MNLCAIIAVKRGRITGVSIDSSCGCGVGLDRHSCHLVSNRSKADFRVGATEDVGRSSQLPLRRTRQASADAGLAAAPCVRWVRVSGAAPPRRRQGCIRNLTGRASGEGLCTPSAAASPLARPVRTLIRASSADEEDPPPKPCPLLWVKARACALAQPRVLTPTRQCR